MQQLPEGVTEPETMQLHVGTNASKEKIMTLFDPFLYARTISSK